MNLNLGVVLPWLRQSRQALIRVALVALLLGALVPGGPAAKGIVGGVTNPRPNPLIDPPDLD